MTAGNGHQHRDLRQEQDKEQLRGEWMAADQSDNRLEVCETWMQTPEGLPLFAVRNSFNHGRILYATEDQIGSLGGLRDQLRRITEERKRTLVRA